MDTLKGSCTSADSAQAMNLQNYGQFAIKKTSIQVFKWEQAYIHIPGGEKNESECFLCGISHRSVINILVLESKGYFKAGKQLCPCMVTRRQLVVVFHLKSHKLKVDICFANTSC